VPGKNERKKKERKKENRTLRPHTVSKPVPSKLFVAAVVVVVVSAFFFLSFLCPQLSCASTTGARA
jgi:hypothetical protein